MGYEIHMTRADDWMEDQTPITLDEVRNMMPISEKFRIDETGIIAASAPQGQTLTADFGPYLEYTDEAGRKTYIIFRQGECPSFRFQDYRQLLAMFDLAQRLGARLQGDEGEEYERREIEKQLAVEQEKAQKPAKKGGLFSRLLGR